MQKQPLKMFTLMSIVLVLGLARLSVALEATSSHNQHEGSIHNQGGGSPGTEGGSPGIQGIEDIYSLVVPDIYDKQVSLNQYRGKVTLFVNVASECGFTDRHYKGMKKIKEVLGHTDKFEVLAFPCDQFGGQEPKGNVGIQKFVKDVYKVNFPVLSKSDVIGEKASPVWKYLASKSGNPPSWNFFKYLVGPEGEMLGSWGPWSDIDEIYGTIKTAVDSLLGQKPAGIYGPLRPGGGKNDIEPSQTQDGIIGPPSDSKQGPTPHQSKKNEPTLKHHLEL